MKQYDIKMYPMPGAVKKFGVGGYHKIIENKKPQIDADARRFMIAYLRFIICNTKRFYTDLCPKENYTNIEFKKNIQ
ncbi:MAG: hypothetical protein O8C61_07185 [Candidatus Methanoperedens sp.]|nr:hypothetical protein [Candidatus Methanoperedens sp.]